MRLQLLHLHTVFKTWPTFQELMSIILFRRRCWSQQNLSKIETYRVTKVKYEDYEEIFFLPPDVGILVCLRFLISNSHCDLHIDLLTVAYHKKKKQRFPHREEMRWSTFLLFLAPRCSNNKTVWFWSLILGVLFLMKNKKKWYFSSQLTSMLWSLLGENVSVAPANSRSHGCILSLLSKLNK